MKRLYIFIILLFPFVLFPFDEIQKCEVDYYYIQGNSVDKLISELKQKNNISGGHFGYTSYSYKNKCSKVETKCKVRIPNWKDYEETENESLKADWFRFYTALIKHEQRHVDIFYKYMDDASSKSKDKSCNESNIIYKSALQAISNEQVLYDKETEHGVKDGAYFGSFLFQAIAFSTKTGEFGFSNDYSTREEADKAAIEHCNASDCKILIWSRNACASLAIGDRNGFGTNWAKDQKESESKALEVCSNYTKNCKILKTICPSK
jgi:serine/threonine-protein kinase